LPSWVAKEKMGTLLLASEMPVPIPRNRTVACHSIIWQYDKDRSATHATGRTLRFYYLVAEFLFSRQKAR
jgi:hypothetical protein